MKYSDLEELATLIRYYILLSTTEARSGHVTSSFSATELMTALMFGGFFKFDLDNPEYQNNDRLLFSKGHASPLFYALYAAAGKVSVEELKTLRKFGSKLEGHPTRAFEFTEAPTGSLGQGISIGVGMALNAKHDKLSYKTFVLLGDSEMAEGSVWEALEIASYYKLNNLVGILDVNRLGQRGETMYGYDIEIYKQKIEAFGWQTAVIDGHSFSEINEAFEKAKKTDKPFMIIGKTIKGNGVSFLENKEGWHGKALSKEECEEAYKELGEVDLKIKGKIDKPDKIQNQKIKIQKYNSKIKSAYKIGEMVSTRKAYGNALVKLGKEIPEMVVLDAEVSNSTFAEFFKKEYPERFFEMFIAEQNMMGVAVGLSRRGKRPFVSTFGAFFSRAYDQIRMAGYAGVPITFVGSHAGVSIGEDGVSQMALEDIGLFRSVFNSVVLYPSDAVSGEKLTEVSLLHDGISYIRTTRKDLPVLYKESEEFKIGGSKILKKSLHDVVTVVAAGITVYEALKAYEELKKQGVLIRVIDLYSIKPLDKKTLEKALQETKGLIIVEDHYTPGGVGEAVKSGLNSSGNVVSLAVRKLPKSGKPEELLEYEEIAAKSILKEVKRFLKIK